jgi:DNA-binding NtrC family response regulator
MKPKILIADDEAHIRRVMSLLLEEEGYEVMTAVNGREVLEQLTSFRPDVILLDQQMPVMTGVETLEQIRTLHPGQIVIFITAFGSVALAVDTIKKGAYDFIEKPFDNDDLILKVRRAVEHCNLKGEIRNLKNKLKENHASIIGENEGLKQVMARVRRVAETNATVLVNGESGTGKELIAHAIHTYSDRSGGPFVSVNCGAIPLSLMENELFGHEKGAFTDAREAQAGTFERANGGTLFLDEIGELPMDAQVKLLRVLEERKIMRIGGKRPIPVDVRIVAATNRNLEEEVKVGRFRLDLLYRLNVFTIHIPPLRERKDDIPQLVDFFIRKHNRALNLSVQSITRSAMERITAYDWPGNVRDLENAIQSGMILTPDGIIQTTHLPLRVKGYEQADTTTVIRTENNSIREMNAQVEKEVILEALKKHNYNRTLTAEDLGISRKTLFNKMKRYELGS